MSKKRVVSLLLVVAMLAVMLTGCGNKVASDGKVLNVYCWNDEFVTRVTDHYPGYTKVDATTGKIGDVTVKWIITPNENNAYQNALDAALEKQSSASADDKVDMFLVEADYALKYVDTDYTLALKDLGITDKDLETQFQYTKDVMTNAKGVLKGVSWQGCPAGLVYNREIAKTVLGTDDPVKVQEYVKDWATFETTAATMKENGVNMIASVNDTYRTYSNNVTTKWVVGNKINIDENLKAWVEQSKRMVDAGQTATYDLWSDDWKLGFYPDGNVFCYFGPAWFIDYCMAAEVPESIAAQGGWGLVKGPQGFYWGGTWICAAEGTDNGDLIKDIMLKMTTDEGIMKTIVEKKNDFVNNKPAMEAMAKSSYTSKVLGGQNPLPIYLEGIVTIDLSNMSKYDQGCNESFQKAMKNYFDGVATYEEALDLFYKSVIEKYPNLTK